MHSECLDSLKESPALAWGASVLNCDALLRLGPVWRQEWSRLKAEPLPGQSHHIERTANLKPLKIGSLPDLQGHRYVRAWRRLGGRHCWEVLPQVPIGGPLQTVRRMAAYWQTC